MDEVGRGCWAGPLVAAAVLMPAGLAPEPGTKIADSKKLSKKQREIADLWIRRNALAIGVGWVSPAEIDELGLTEGVRLAMSRALDEIKEDYDELIIDGNINYFANNPKAQAIVKADSTVPTVSVASIVAKVARDNYMANLPAKYAGYSFAAHVGYGTAAHIAALKELGICDIHRLSYKPIKAYL